MRDLLQTLGGATIIFAAVSGLIYIANLERIWRFDINSPYVAAFMGLGIAIGILFAMVMMLIQNYQEKLEQGQKLVQYLTENDGN